MALIKRAMIKQVISVLSCVFRCHNCENTETVNSETARKCSKCGNDMQLVSSCCFTNMPKKSSND